MILQNIVDSATLAAQQDAQERAEEQEELESVAEGYGYDDDSDDDEEPEVQFLSISVRGAIEAAKKDMFRLPRSMYLAEIPRNSEQSYRDNDLSGPIVWFFADAEEKNDEDAPLYYPGFYDLAGGISLSELRNNLGKLRNSGGVNIEGKHGIGARISALRASPDGCEWWSLKDGQVNGFKLWMDEHDRLAYQIYENYEPDVLHPEIVAAGHGTQVTFTGMKPLPINKMPTENIARWLSARWYDRPENITMRVQRSDGGFGTIPTQKQALEALSEFHVDDVELTDATVKVFVLKPHQGDIPLGERFYYANLYRTKDGASGKKAKPKGKFFIVYDDEIYMNTVARGVPNRLRFFGITHGHRRVVMVVFPSPEHYGPNDVRTRIESLKQDDVCDSELPIDRWAKEFNEKMPEQLRDYIETAAIGNQAQNMQVINNIIMDHAQYLAGPSRNRKIVPDAEKGIEGDGSHPHTDTNDPTKKKKKKKKKKKSGKKKPKPTIKGRTAKRTSKRFCAPKVVWIEPDADDALFVDPGVYLPHCDNGRGELQLNRNWKPLIKWQNQIENYDKHDFTVALIQHYTEQAMALIHVDAVMRSRLMKQPDPSPDDFRNAMLLPNCRDMALREVIRVSSKVEQE